MFTAAASWVVGAAAAALGVPCSVMAAECVAGAFSKAHPGAGASAAAPDFVVLVPAHDEAAGIAATVQGILEQLPPNGRVVVIADNCSDDTAAIARRTGAEVIERVDPTRRGKGYAIAFGLEHLAPSPPSVVILVDADCRLGPGTLTALARQAAELDRPVQAMYLFEPPPNPSPRSVVSTLAILVRSQARTLGLHALGLPCQLTGSGMAFPWHVLRKAPPLDAHLVEDLVLGLELALLGHPPASCPEARVTSELPQTAEAETSQRRRWEHGYLKVMLGHGPKMVWRGLTSGRMDVTAMGLDLLVPPLALLAMGVLGTGAVALLVFTAGGSPLGVLIAGADLALLGAGVGAAWYKFGRDLPLRYVAAIPMYVVWKVPLYLSFFLKRGQQTWVRTARGQAR